MRWLLVIFVPLCMWGCTDRDQAQSGTILPADVRLQTGDVVFRQGSGFTSQVVRMAEGGGVYSHVGIVVDSAGVPMIVHAVPGEPEFDGDVDRVKMERPEDFYATTRAQQGAVCRPTDGHAGNMAAQHAVQVYRRRTLFDHDYDDSDTTRMYCTELVVFAYGKTKRPLTGIRRHHLRLIGFESHCVLPSDLLHCRELKIIKTF